MGWPLTGTLRSLLGLFVRVFSTDLSLGRTLIETVRQVLLSGASITIPFVVTILVLGIVFDFVTSSLGPFVQALTLLGITEGQGGIVAQGLALAILLGIVFMAGVFAESGPTTGVSSGLGRAVGALPGIGSVYNSFDRMSDVMLDGDVQSFREVKLIEFPQDDIFSLAFLTSEVESGTASDEKMLVLFVPLAPNPVMGGFMVFVPAHRVRDIDMTIEEAFQAIVTSGVALADSGP